MIDIDIMRQNITNDLLHVNIFKFMKIVNIVSRGLVVNLAFGARGRGPLWASQGSPLQPCDYFGSLFLAAAILATTLKPKRNSSVSSVPSVVKYLVL
jgi:hypothetical protein